MTNPEAAVAAAQNFSFERVRNEAHDSLPTSALQAVLNEEQAWTIVGVETTAHEEAPVESGSRHIKRRCTENENKTAQEVGCEGPGCQQWWNCR